MRHRSLRSAPHLCLQTLALALALLPIVARAQTTIHVPADQPTIQAGINAAHNGDTVLVAPGTYFENIDFKGKSITLTSITGVNISMEPTTPDLSGATITIIDGRNNGPVVTIHSGEAAVLNGFTLQNGSTLVNNVYGGPGGIDISGSSARIQNNIITQNYCIGISVAHTSSSDIYANLITQTLDSSQGCNTTGAVSAIFVDATDTDVVNPVDIEGNIIENNAAGADHVSYQSGTVTLLGITRFHRNIVRNNYSNGPGGAVFIGASNVALVWNLIYGNKTDCVGGGLYLSGSSPASGVNPLLSPESVAVFIENNTIYQNSAGHACDSTYNGSGGSQIFTAVLPRYEFVNNIIVANDSMPALNAPVNSNVDGNTEWLVFDHNLVWNPSGPLFGNNMVNEVGTYGNISTDPLFANASQNDFHLTRPSPAIDSGNNNANFSVFESVGFPDMDGNSAPTNANGIGWGVVDMGAYEYPGNLTNYTDEYFYVLGQTEAVYDVPAYQPLTIEGGVVYQSHLNTICTSCSVIIDIYEDLKHIDSVNTDMSGYASNLTAPPLCPGLHTFLTTYQGSLPPGTSIKTVIRAHDAPNSIATSTALISSLNPSIFGQLVTFNTTLSFPTSPGCNITAPSGSVTFTDGTTVLGTQPVDSSGHVSFSTTSLALGNHTITATYIPTNSFAGSNTSLTQQVLSGYATTTTLTSFQNPANFRQSITLTATLASPTATPLGTLTISDGTTVLASENITGPGWPALHFTSSTLSAGPHNLTATYTPGTGATTATSSATLAQVINPPATVTTLTATPNPTTSFQSITVTVTVTPAPGVTGAGIPTGTVNFFTGPITLGSASLDATGTAVFIANLPAGVYSGTAQYVGSSSFAASTSSSITETVLKADTVTALIAAPNPAIQRQTVTLTAAIAPTLAIPAVPGINTMPTGTVTFFDGASPIATSAIAANGSATASTTALIAGPHSITAAYSGDANFNPSASAAASLTISPSDYSISAPAISIQTQHHATLNITINTLGGLTDTLNLSCSNLPLWATCTFAQPVFPLDNNAATASYTATVLIDTDEIPLFMARNTTPPGSRRIPAILAASLLCCLFTRRRRTFARLAAILVTVAALTLSGCSGYYPSSVTPGVYNIQINGTTTTTQISHFATVQLTVTQ